MVDAIVTIKDYDETGAKPMAGEININGAVSTFTDLKFDANGIIDAASNLKIITPTTTPPAGGTRRTKHRKTNRRKYLGGVRRGKSRRR
jgi:hypothetical protein